MYFDVETKFNQFIHQTFLAKPHIQKFLLNHERKKVAIENLCEQIRLAELGLPGKMRMNQKKYVSLIHGIARMFCDAALTAKEHEIMSEAAKKAMKSKEDVIRDAEECIKDLEQDAQGKLRSYGTGKEVVT